MRTILILYHSATGGTLQMAQAAAEGAQAHARSAATEDALLRVQLTHARNADAQMLLDAQGYIFATPENLASMAGVMKDFFDRSYYAVLDQIVARPYASMICAGSDGAGAARQIERICTGWRLKRIADPLIVCTYAQTPAAIAAPKTIAAADLARCRELGASLAAGLAMGIF